MYKQVRRTIYRHYRKTDVAANGDKIKLLYLLTRLRPHRFGILTHLPYILILKNAILPTQ